MVDTDGFYHDSAQAIQAFAERFTAFEWTYLCSYRWFVTALESAAHRGTSISVQLRAQKKLLNEGLRPNRIAAARANNECESSRWWS